VSFKIFLSLFNYSSKIISCEWLYTVFIKASATPCVENGNGYFLQVIDFSAIEIFKQAHLKRGGAFHEQF